MIMTEMDALREVALDYLKYHHTRYYEATLEKQEKEKARLEKQIKKAEQEIGAMLAANRRYERSVHKYDRAGLTENQVASGSASYSFISSVAPLGVEQMPNPR
jgi:hypothetical protein